MNQQKKICIVGPTPPPFGGISEHIIRLIINYGPKIDKVVDFHPISSNAEKYKFSDIEVIHAPHLNICLRIIWLIHQISKVKCSAIHFHFSLPKSILFLLFYKKKKNTKLILTLHNGDLRIGSFYKNFIIKYLINFVITNFDYIVALSSDQSNFYISIGVPAHRVVKLPSYLPLNSINLLGSVLPPSFDELRRRNINIVLTSGYPEKFYKFDWLINYAKSRNLNAGSGVGFVLAVYGSGDWPWIDELEHAASKSGVDFLILKNLDRENFLGVLGSSDVYVRPTTMDSYGIAIADAINLGLSVIASDVCERYPGCTLFPAGNEEDFYQRLDDYLCSKKLQIANNPIQHSKKILKLYSDFYSMVTTSES